MAEIKNAPLAPYATLRAGGPAERLVRARTADQVKASVLPAQERGEHVTTVGWGSNILPSDQGVPGLTVAFESGRIEIGDTIVADAGAGLQELFLKAAQAGLAGLSFAVGIPGSVGGALVSNAGAYRSNVSRHLVEIEVARQGRAEWVSPEIMEFSYRDSVLRRPNPPQMVLLRVRLDLPRGNRKEVFDAAREWQRQRISKQPPPASAGSFFKNVNSKELAERLPNLPDRLKEAGVVPAGYLIEAVGLKGRRNGGAQLHPRHANFMTNVGGATATEIRRLAEEAKAAVWKEFGVTLEEECLYLGDWSGWVSSDPARPSA